MRSLAAAACLAGVGVVLAGCGVQESKGQIATKTIRDDWVGFYTASDSPFPSRPDLKGQNTLRHIVCGEHEDAHRMLPCTLVVGHGKSGGRATVLHVIVRFDKQGILRQWKFAG
jgi:hypothetical protein